MRILIITPPINLTGGVSGHFRGLKNYWNEDVKYFTAYKNNNRGILSIFPYIYNKLKFLYTLFVYRPDNTIINVSLKKGFFSKNLYARLMHIFHFKYTIFIHGWLDEKEDMLNKPQADILIRKCHRILVLSKRFKDKLVQKAGIDEKKIYLTTTKVNNDMLECFDISHRTGEFKNLLFVSRVEKEKGIFIALETYRMLKEENPTLTFTIVGEGRIRDKVEQYIKDHDIKDVIMKGALFNKNLSCEFIKGDFFILPSYSEGMPAALLEAMAFGLPIATSSVGAIPDFFEDGKMGIISEKNDAITYYTRIKEYINNREKTVATSVYNYNYAKSNFYSSEVAKKIEDILKTN